MAEAIMKDLVLDEVEQRHRVLPIIVSSAGTHAVKGSPASRHAIEVAKRHDINLNFHRSKPITEALARNADLILTMEKNHTAYIQSLWPFCNEVTELKSFGQETKQVSLDVDVQDPIGLNEAVYTAVFDELYREISRISQRIFSLAEQKSGN
jgi:protein-tyrosine phosphatase